LQRTYLNHHETRLLFDLIFGDILDVEHNISDDPGMGCDQKLGTTDFVPMLLHGIYYTHAQTEVKSDAHTHTHTQAVHLFVALFVFIKN